MPRRGRGSEGGARGRGVEGGPGTEGACRYLAPGRATGCLADISGASQLQPGTVRTPGHRGAPAVPEAERLRKLTGAFPDCSGRALKSSAGAGSRGSAPPASHPDPATRRITAQTLRDPRRRRQRPQARARLWLARAQPAGALWLPDGSATPPRCFDLPTAPQHPPHGWRWNTRLLAPAMVRVIGGPLRAVLGAAGPQMAKSWRHTPAPRLGPSAARTPRPREAVLPRAGSRPPASRLKRQLLPIPEQLGQSAYTLLLSGNARAALTPLGRRPGRAREDLRNPTASQSPSSTTAAGRRLLRRPL